ncbi:MAG: hypothetical protein RL748_399, partial [Pseudomonadota bacterium]
NCLQYGALDAWAHQAAFEMETELEQVVHQIVPRVSVYSWQHLNLYYFMMAAKWYRIMWQALGHHFNGAKLHIFVCDNPLSYYFNSFVPSTALIHYCSQNGIELMAYPYGEKAPNTQLVPDLRGVRPPNDNEEILAHMPTCMYDIHYFNRETQASGKTILNLESKYFNMPVAHHQHLTIAPMAELLHTVPEAWRAALPELRQQLLHTLEKLLAPHLPINYYRIRQAEHIADIYVAQMLSLGLLNQYFGAKKPAKLLLSDHDCDFHGPLIAFAEQHHLPVLYVPHSKTTSDIFFRYKNITCYSHPIQGDVILSPDGRSVPNPKLNFPETFRFTNTMPGPVKKVAILLQVISLNGIYVTRYGAYMDGVKRMVAWCRKMGLEFSIRCKPSYSLIKLLSEETGVDGVALVEAANLPMATYAESSDLCLMYDAPTSAELEFLTRGIPVLNPIPKPLVNIESMVCNPNVITPNVMDEVLRQATLLVQDPVALEAFRRKQTLAYVNLFQNAQPLRVFL